MPPVTFVGSVCKIHAVGVLCSKITDVHVIEVHDVRTWKFVCFRKIFRFLLHNTRDVTRGKRETIPWALNLCWGPKSYNVISTFFKTVHLFPKDVRFEHGGPNLFLSPGPILPRYAPAHHDCLAKMAKFVYKNTCPSVTNYLIQNAVDYQSHLTIENNLKVEKKKYYFENKHYFPPQMLGVRVETNIPKNSKAIIILALCSGRYLLHHKDIENDQAIFGNVKFAVSQWPISHAYNFLYETRLYRGNAILEILYSRLKKNY